MTNTSLRLAIQCAAIAALLAGPGYAAVVAMASKAPAIVVSQKGRAFSVKTLYISSGETFRIVNDEVDTPHHAYIDSESFRYDSGDQAPGSYAEISFPVSGTFTVLCGIHPKMKLVVNVK